MASGSVVSTTTSTSVVSGSSSNTEPSSASTPSIWNTAREVSLLNRTLRVIVYSSVVSPSAAVTVMLKMFSPATSSLSPTTSNVASGSVVSTSTSTASVNGSSSTTSSIAVTWPLISTLLRVVSVFSATFRITL